MSVILEEHESDSKGRFSSGFTVNKVPVSPTLIPSPRSKKSSPVTPQEFKLMQNKKVFTVNLD